MTKIRLLPVVVMAIAALLVLKTMGLVTHGSYVLGGVSVAQAAGASEGDAVGTTEADQTVTPAGEPTMEDISPTLSDGAPTIGAPAAEAGGGHGAPAADETANEAGEIPALDAPPAGHVMASQTYCVDSDATITASGDVILRPVAAEVEGEAVAVEPRPVPEGSFAQQMAADCLPSGDVVPTEISDGGTVVPLIAADGVSGTEQQLLERLTARRTELEQYESDLALRASIVDAAEKRIAERAATLEALEAQISGLVDQRTEMEAGQFAGIVAMYETMRPKDAANIFNDLNMDVLLRVAKTMNPRKMAPILAEMSAPRAQELTVQMATLADKPATEMTQDDLAALPQIVGQ
ncbi:MotE family protein [Devosia ginsengisoli]|uniref:Magnesium transporter MgtE intracellular domain-containing protein n=1 Tax=Devosia ginsengisoli TaxID=400770 RepID=A0A5B8LU09_9HYPH|nr:hypothetical protein [Devosia ginsengisoli]QDZ10780.1 hypothetical protein FPZ08_08460 [Devosia ginsengisoli]